MVWLSLPRDCAQYAVSSRTGGCCAAPPTYPGGILFSECVFRHAFEPRIVNRGCIFHLERAGRSLPAVLNMGDWEKMRLSCCFARKVDVDSELGRALLEGGTDEKRSVDNPAKTAYNNPCI